MKIIEKSVESQKETQLKQISREIENFVMAQKNWSCFFNWIYRDT